MAKRNRKNGEEGHRTMVWGISLFGVAAVLAGIYLGLFNACETIGRQIKKLEYDQAELRKRVVNEERNWAMARSIGNMERLMAAHGIVMSWPQERNIIRLQAAEPAVHDAPTDPPDADLRKTARPICDLPDAGWQPHSHLTSIAGGFRPLLPPHSERQKRLGEEGDSRLISGFNRILSAGSGTAKEW